MLFLAGFVFACYIAQAVSFCELNGSSLKCDGESLENVISQYGSIKDSLKTISINNCNTAKLEDDSIPFKRVEHLQIACNIEQVKSQSFRGLQRLVHLNLSNNALARFPRNGFKNTPNLEVLDLSSNHLRNPENDFLEDLRSIRVLHLERNRITNIATSALKSPTLEEVYLGDNNINLMVAGIYDGSPKLRVLDARNVNLNGIMRDLFEDEFSLEKVILRGNNLNDLNSSVFRNNKEMLYLDLSYCELREIDDKMFAVMTKLRTLKLAGNYFPGLASGVFDQLLDLEELDLSDMGLASIQGGLIGKNLKLKKLDVSANKLTDLGDLTKYHELNYLNASFNKISVIGKNNLRWQQLQEVHLRGNSLDYLDPEIFSGIQSQLTKLDLRDNRLVFINSNIFESLLLLWEFELTGNPWDCKCLDELLAVLIKKHLRFSKSGYFDGEKSVCVVGGDNCKYDKNEVKKYYELFNS